MAVHSPGGEDPLETGDMRQAIGELRPRRFKQAVSGEYLRATHFRCFDSRARSEINTSGGLQRSPATRRPLVAATSVAAVVELSNGASLDFHEIDGEISSQHYAFLIGEEDFDQVFEAVRKNIDLSEAPTEIPPNTGLV